MTAAESPPSDGPWWSQLSGAGVALAAAVGVVGALVLAPLFATPFWVLLGRTLFLAMVLLLAYTAALHWPARWQPAWLARWLLPPLAVALAAPVATFVIYVLWVGNVDSFLASEAAVAGYFWTAGSGLIVGLLLSLGALLRDQQARARQLALQFELERETLERRALDARLGLLEQQIQPHFLFNTLANIQALVQAGSPRAPAVLESLIGYLRAALPGLEEGEATWGRELERVRAYLSLMHMRMPDRLTVAYDTDPSLSGQPFPALALVTLVENAVRHGIDPQINGGRIEVGAQRRPGGWRAWVSDTGSGMAPQAVPGTGLNNLRGRLKAAYGERARLTMGEAQPHGLHAEIEIDVEGDGGTGPDSHGDRGVDRSDRQLQPVRLGAAERGARLAQPDAMEQEPRPAPHDAPTKGPR